jgi:2-polyprenyl-6-methoxyphenol hydroxylase-like FAD-dependent oxidoreductase
MTNQAAHARSESAPLRVHVAGGSLGGLMAGLELRSAGCDVTISERSDRVMDDRGAGIVMQAETLHLLKKHGLADEQTAGVWSHHRQYLGRDGEAVSLSPSAQLMTSWGLLYRCFRSAFPAEDYHEGRGVVGFEQDEDEVRITLSDGRTERCGLLVGADGARSLCRHRLLPHVVPRYAGYVAWRGVVPESRADTGLLDVFADRFTFYQMPNSHILCYLIPGADGELEPGHRRLNWVWYWNATEGELAHLLTGQDGRTRDFSVPPGEVQAKIVEVQRERAQLHLPGPFVRLVEATEEPFLQPVLDLSVPRMAFDRVCLIGDAAFVPRPHTAASTSKAAANVIALGDAITRHGHDVASAMREWEPAQLALGRQLETHGRRIGDPSQFGSR